jgi:ParB-like chromosome segregation protein Spo0J
MPSQPQQGMVKISELQVNPEYEHLLPPLLDEDLKNLEKSILEDGVLHPFLINPDKVVLDGHNRLTICQRHSINEVPFVERSFNTDLEEMEFVISFNLNRRHLTMIQKVELGLTILKKEMEKARRRQGTRTDLITNKEEDNNIPSKLKESDEEQGEATEIAAKKVGLGKITFWKAKRIAEFAQTDQHVYRLWRAIADGNRSINSVYQELFQQEKPPTSSSPSRPPIPAPKIEGVFQVIVIDIPLRNLEKFKKTNFPFDEKNCVLWVWSPTKSLCDTFSLLHHWQFQVQTMLTWVKTKRGRGKWLLNQTEHCILATIGEPTANSQSHSTALIVSSGKHNSKPPEFYSLVESVCDGRKLNVSPLAINRPGWELMEMNANVRQLLD